MAHAEGPNGSRERAEAARLIALVPAAFSSMLPPLLADPDLDVVRQAIQSAHTMVREDTVDGLFAALGREEVSDEAVGALARFGNALLPEIARRMDDDAVPLEVRRELPAVLVRIGTIEAEQVLLGSLLHADPTLRHRVIASLNKLRTLHPEVQLDTSAVDLLLAAEIVGHYRSYQVLGPLQQRLRPGDPVLEAMGSTMEQEIERIFRVMALLLPHAGLHDAYVGLRSSNPIVRGNAIEFLDNVLKPELRQLLVPLLDGGVTVAERIALANGLVGAPLDTPEQAVETLLASEDPWLRSCAAYAIGAMQLESLREELDRLEREPDPAMRQTVQAAKRRLAGLSEPASLQEPVPASMGVGVGSG
jgi:AAA family ATP:ADP antiporter